MRDESLGSKIESERDVKSCYISPPPYWSPIGEDFKEVSGLWTSVLRISYCKVNACRKFSNKTS